MFLLSQYSFFLMFAFYSSDIIQINDYDVDFNIEEWENDDEEEEENKRR